jgi:hypothetical protein
MISTLLVNDRSERNRAPLKTAGEAFRGALNIKPPPR